MAKGQSVKFYDTMAAALNPIQRRYEEDPRRSMAASLRKSSMGGPPITTHMQGLASLAEAGLGAYMENQALEEKEAAIATTNQRLSDSFNAFNPQIMPTYEDDDLLSATAFKEENPNLYSEKDPYRRGGNISNVIEALEEHKDPTLTPAILNLKMNKMTQALAEGEAAKLRGQEIEDRDDERAWKLANPVLKPGVNVPFPDDVQSQKESLLRVKAGEKQKILEEKQKAKEEARKNKPMPASAIKQQSALLEKIGLAQGINADMASISGLLEENKIELGLFDNWLSAGKNYVGMSDAESRNYATFNSTLEKMRNDSLRLNNGVQTEGDAQRAWNELFTNINDQDYVKQRLKEIIVINKRAENLQKYQVDVLRNEFDKPALESMPSVRGAPGNTLTDPLSEEDQEAVDWARANPNDPRSAQILKLHGG